MVRAEQTFNRLYGQDAIIEAIVFDARVKDINATVDEMMRSIAMPGTDSTVSGAHIKIYGPLDATLGVPPDRIALLRDSFRLNLGLGDFRILVRLRNRRGGARFTSLNSMQPDGRRFSGTFFSTARAPASFGTSSKLKNTVCHHEVASRYLWGSEGETFDGCVRAVCAGLTVSDCRITYSKASPGFLAEAQILPNAGTPGTIVGNCCDGYFSWAWATGFESISVNASGTGFTISGHRTVWQW